MGGIATSQGTLRYTHNSYWVHVTPVEHSHCSECRLGASLAVNPRSILTPAFHHLGNHLEIRAAALELAAQRSLLYRPCMGQLVWFTV